MGKINLKAEIKREDEDLVVEVIGIKNNNKIVYKENDITVTLTLLNNKIEMNRTCNEYKINLIFDNKKKSISTYNVFGAPKIFELETFTKKLIIKEDKIEIDYELEGNNFSYSLKIGG